MNKKMQETILRDGQRRRSPRILAIDACKENPQEKKPVQYFRTRLKRKIDEADTLASISKLTKQVWKGRDNTTDDDDSTKDVEWRSIRIPENQKREDQAIRNENSSVLPDKHVLQLVLDTLQRRDNNEIFAEPVDRDEVDDYYEIIKEPMDFGTMRAKLHEGMYQNLEQFEHDVFLIPENAMFFNSSGTVYHRQARAIHDLAQKVFNSLKTDPENFVLEFSGTRRRSMRKAWSDVPSKEMLHSQPGSSTFRQASKKNPGCNGMTNRFRSRNSSTGNRCGRLSDFEVTDRRSTYWTQGSSFKSKMNHVDSSFYSSSQPLILMNQGETSYEDSLMSFVKDLGPIAQMVAKRKLSWNHEPNSSIQSEKNMVATTPQRKPDNGDSVKTTLYPTFSDFSSGTPSFLKISNTIDLTKDGESENGSRHGRIEFGTPVTTNSDFGLPRKEIPDFSTPAKEKRDIGALGKQRLCESSATMQEKTERTLPKEKADTIAMGKEKLDHDITLPKDQEAVTRTRRRSETRKGSMKNKNFFSLKDMASPDQDFRPVILALENPHCNKATEYKPRNKKNLAQVPCNVPVEFKAIKKEGGSSLPQANPTLETHKPVASDFMFGLPFIQARMNKMSAKSQEGVSLSEMSARGRVGFSSLRAGGSLSDMNAKGREGFSSLHADESLSEMNVRGQEGFSLLTAGGRLSEMNAKGGEGFSCLHADGSLSENAKGQEGFSLLLTGVSLSEMNARGREGFSSLREGGSLCEMNARGQEGFSLMGTGVSLSEMNARGREGFSSLREGGSLSEMNARGQEGFSLMGTGVSLSEKNARGREGFSSLREGGSLSEMNARGQEGLSLSRAGVSLSEMNSRGREEFSSLREGGSMSEMNARGQEGFSWLRTGESLSETNARGQQGFSMLRAGESLNEMNARGQKGFSLLRAGGSLSGINANWRDGLSAPRAGGSSEHHQLKRPLFDQGGSDRSLNCSLDINKPYVFGQSLSRQSFDSLETNLALQL